MLAGQARERRAKLKREDFFAYRARQWGLRGSGITADDLHALWLAQEGRCALTGRELTSDAHLDHKLPRCRGGATVVGNLQWLSEEANRAKARLTNDEFVALCVDVLRERGVVAPDGSVDLEADLR